MNNQQNGVFEDFYEDGDVGIEKHSFFWRFGDIEKGPFFNMRECAKDYCAALTDMLPEMAELFNGETWERIYLTAGISKEIRSKLTEERISF